MDFPSTVNFELQHGSALRIPHLMWKHLGLPESDSDSERPGSSADDVKPIFHLDIVLI